MTLSSRRAVLLSGLGGLLAGCGFRPVYAPGLGGGEAAPALAAIEVGPIFDRPGQILREALKARLASDTGVPHRFELNVDFSIAGEGLGVLPTSEVTRVRLTGTATWVLTKTDPKQTRLISGSEKTIDGFDTFDTQYFAMDMQNEKAQRRIAERLADQIRTRLAVWFSQHPAEAA